MKGGIRVFVAFIHNGSEALISVRGLGQKQDMEKEVNRHGNV